MTGLDEEIEEVRKDEPEEDIETTDGEGGEDTPEERARAKRMGWIPEDEWDEERAERDGKRKPKQFLSARAYIAGAESNMPMLRAQLRNLDAKLADANKKTGEVFDILQEQRKLNAAAVERAKKEAREQVEREREQAVAEGDVEAFKAADAKLDKLDDEEVPPGKEPQQQRREEDPDIAAFKKANASWFTVDARLTNNMIDEFGDVKQEQPGLSMQEQLAEAKKRIMKRFPEKFGVNPRRESARPGVTPPTGSREAGSVDRRFAALTDDERRAWDRVRNMVESRGQKISKAEWLNEIGR